MKSMLNYIKETLSPQPSPIQYHKWSGTNSLPGNKSDSGLERAVRREEGQRLAREYQVAFMETSAKTGLNVEAAFAHVARALVAKANPVDPSRLAVRAQPSQEQRSSCPPCS